MDGNIDFIKKLIFFLFMGIISHNLCAQSLSNRLFREDFISGEKTHILKYRANLRMEPNINGKVIAILSLHDEIEIVENSRVREQINDVWAYWYKIKYRNIEGYMFGGNIAWVSLVTDIDNNGIMDYFYVQQRFFALHEEYTRQHVDMHLDIHIYINGQRINTTIMRRYFTGVLEGSNHWGDYCIFDEKDGYVLIQIYCTSIVITPQ